MAFTSVPVTGTIKHPDGTLATGAQVSFTLNVGISDGTNYVSPEAVTETCDGSGNFTASLYANDDTTTQPQETFYSVKITAANKPWVTLDTFNIVVPKADVAGVNLFTLATLLNPESVSPFVSQIIAGTGVTLSPSSGTGVVTINASGGSSFTPTGDLGGTSSDTIVETVLGGKVPSTLSIQGASGTNLGATQTVDFGGVQQEIWLLGTLSANLTVTVANGVPGCRLQAFVTQPASGGPFTLTVTDGVDTVPVTISAGAGTASAPVVEILDASTISVVSDGFSNPMTAAQDLIVATTGGVPARLAIGADGQSLIVRSDGTLGYVDDAIKVDAWGAVGDGTTDDSTAINNAITTAGATGKQVGLGAGKTYALHSPLVPADNVSIFGHGPSSVLKPIGAVAGFSLQRTSSTPLTGCTFRDFAIDGSAQTGLVKGIFIQYLKNCTFDSLVVSNCEATGIGTDFLYDCSITNCVLNGNGRAYTPGQAGCAGIGIGTGGGGAVETFTIVGNRCTNNGSYGIFAEAQITLAFVQGVTVAGNTCQGNGKAGIGVSGSQGMTVVGNVCNANGTAGTGTGTANISIDMGTLNRDNPQYTVVSGNVVTNGLAHGIYVVGNTTAAKAPARLQISNNVVAANGSTTAGHDGHGIFLDGSQHAFVDITVQNNTVALNEADGIVLSGGSGHTNIAIRGNDVYGNGRAGGTTVDGINVSSTSVTGLQIVGNQCYETSAHQTNGINLASTATITQGNIRGNDVRGNATAGMLVNATLSSVEIADNAGYNPVGVVTVAVPASTVAVAAAQVNRTFYITAGAGTTTVAISGGPTVTLTPSALNTVRVPAGQTLTPTYTNAPTWVVEGE